MPNLISTVGTSVNDVQDMGPGGVLNQLPSLKDTANMVRAEITSFNDYKDINGQRYDAQHPNSQSDGDAFGRGNVGKGTVGNINDIKSKNTLLYNSGNKYGPYNSYNNKGPAGELFW